MRSTTRLLAGIAVAGLIAAGCGDSGSKSSGSSTTAGGATSTTAAATTTLQPVTGGTITFGSYSKIQGLDPIVGLGQGTSGGIPMAAVYDNLMRWDTEKKQYIPRIAESATPNADFTEWTVKIKAGVKFSDGTDFNADAVKFGMNRHRVGTSIPATSCADWYACPRNNTSSAAYMSLVKDITVVDATTLKFTLSEPWTSFQYALSAEAGFIPSPTAMKKACPDPTKNANTCPFNTAPVGGGPFMVSSYKPDDVIAMVRNPTYWNAPVYLDGINFLDGGDTGGTGTLDKLKSGTVQAAFLRDAVAVDGARQAKIPGITTLSFNGGILLINGGVNVTCAGGAPAPLCTGKPDGPTPTNPPTKDVAVRQAVVAAIDPNVINDRVFSGKALATSSIFGSKGFPWDPGVAGPKYDLTTAKNLVTQAKAAGWNGSVRIICPNSPAGTNTATAAQTMLQAAGMTVTVSTPESTVQQQAVTSTKDFDIACWGLAISPDDGAIWALAQNLSSTSTSNRIGFNSPVVDQALKDLRVAKTDADRTAAYKKIADESNRLIPWSTFSTVEEYNAYTPKLHGVVGSNRSYSLFDKAWLEK